MAQVAALAITSIQEYLDAEEIASEKHELFRGRIIPRGDEAFAMAGGTSNHGNIIDSLAQVCGVALRSRRPCRFLGDSRKILVESRGSGYYPDGAIASLPNDPDPRRGTYDNPTVIFEVLSPSTENYDRTDKADDYKRLVSLRDYVLIESEKVRVGVFSRLEDGRWAQSVYLPGTTVHLPSLRIDLPVEELYENAVFEDVPISPVEE